MGFRGKTLGQGQGVLGAKPPIGEGDHADGDEISENEMQTTSGSLQACCSILS